jgi:hypothetical protein
MACAGTMRVALAGTGSCDKSIYMWQAHDVTIVCIASIRILSVQNAAGAQASERALAKLSLSYMFNRAAQHPRQATSKRRGG